MKKFDFKNIQDPLLLPNALQKKLNSSNAIKAFNMIDLPLRNHYVRILASLIFSTLVIIAVSLAFSTFELFVVSFIFIILLAGTTIFQIIKCLEDDVYRLEGICEEIYMPNITSKNKNFLSRDYMVMHTKDDKYVKVYNVKRYKLKVDNQLTIYFPKNSIRILNDDTYAVNSLYLLCITKRHAS